MHLCMPDSLILVTCYLSKVLFTNDKKCLIHLYEPEIERSAPSFFLYWRYSWMFLSLRCGWGHMGTSSISFKLCLPSPKFCVQMTQVAWYMYITFWWGASVNVPVCNLMLGTFANAIPFSRLIWWQIMQKKCSSTYPCTGRRINGTPLHK